MKTKPRIKRRRVVKRLSVQQRVIILCKRLDLLVTRAEKCGKHTNMRKTLMARADEVREDLRVLDY